jgi:hypothetical protein
MNYEMGSGNYEMGIRNWELGRLYLTFAEIPTISNYQ